RASAPARGIPDTFRSSFARLKCNQTGALLRPPRTTSCSFADAPSFRNHRTPMSSCPDAIKRLVERFDRQFKQPDYSEANLRIDFVDPMFRSGIRFRGSLPLVVLSVATPPRHCETGDGAAGSRAVE